MACGTVLIAGTQTRLESVSAKNAVNRDRSATRRNCGSANLAGMRTITTWWPAKIAALGEWALTAPITLILGKVAELG